MRLHFIPLLAMALAVSPAAADGKLVEPQIDTEALGEVFFAFDSARLAETMTIPLAGVATWAAEHPNAMIVLDGNADSRGASTYNVSLAMRRARNVQSKLLALGVDPTRITMVTYGEDGLRRSSFALDRRVAIWATEQPLYSVIDRSLVRGTAVVWNKPVPQTALEGPRPEQVVIR